MSVLSLVLSSDHSQAVGVLGRSTPACRSARPRLTDIYGSPLQLRSPARLKRSPWPPTVPPGRLTIVPIAHLANPEIPHLTNPQSPRMTDVTGETCLYGEGSTTTPLLVSEGAAMRVVLADHQV